MEQQKSPVLSPGTWYTAAVYHSSVMETFISAILGWFRAVDLGVNIPLLSYCFLLSPGSDKYGCFSWTESHLFFFMITNLQAYFFTSESKVFSIITSPHNLKVPHMFLQGLRLLPLSLSVLNHHTSCTNKNVLQPGNSLAAQQWKCLERIFVSAVQPFQIEMV